MKTSEFAIIKVRFSPLFNDMIEFDVELNEIPVEKDNVGKDLVVSWKMYDSFNSN